jgi:hypothetical protein
VSDISSLKSFRRIMAIPRRRPFTNLWYKVYREIVRQGHYLSGLPFSITNDTCLLSIPPGSDRHFKLYMAWFTLYNLINVLNYIYILLWGSEVDFKNQAMSVCYTFVFLCIWCVTLLTCVKSHQMVSLINSVIEFAGTFNGMSYFLLHIFYSICLINLISTFSPMETQIQP